MKKLSYLIIIAATFGLFHYETAQAGWKRTNANASIVANTADNLVTRLKEIAKESEGDTVGDYDLAQEAREYAENKLADAYATLIFFAHKSPDQKRYIKQVGKTLSKAQLKRVKAVLKQLAKMPDLEEDQARVQEYILEQSEDIAQHEVTKAEKSFAKEFRTVITEKSREKAKSQPGA
ncbi:MAG: hypothetical protein KDD43_03610 [Bdellovibrionales bacterium]|nr:hypothetical protein [Bdellovibrionales bacterium]